MTAENQPEANPLAVSTGRVALRSCLLAASGTSGFGEELKEAGATRALGGLITKTITLQPRKGNPPPRTWETACGLLNSIGLANPGYQAFEREILPELHKLGCPCIVNIGGKEISEYVELAGRLASSSVPLAIELNLSCPNVTYGGMDLSRKPEALGKVTKAVRAVWKRPLFVKLTPNVDDIKPLVREAAAGGADAAVVANTYVGMAVDWRTRRSRLGRPTGGLSGPAVKPLSLRLTWEAASTGALPVIGCGGITSADDVLEYVVAGAWAVELGTALFRDPGGPAVMEAELKRLLMSMECSSIQELRGTLGGGPAESL